MPVFRVCRLQEQHESHEVSGTQPGMLGVCESNQPWAAPAVSINISRAAQLGVKPSSLTVTHTHSQPFWALCVWVCVWVRACLTTKMKSAVVMCVLNLTHYSSRHVHARSPTTARFWWFLVLHTGSSSVKFVELNRSYFLDTEKHFFFLPLQCTPCLCMQGSLEVSCVKEHVVHCLPQGQGFYSQTLSVLLNCYF